MSSREALPSEWNKNFRMLREQFVMLVDELSPFISPDPSAPRMGISVEKKLAITLHYLKDLVVLRSQPMHLVSVDPPCLQL